MELFSQSPIAAVFLNEHHVALIGKHETKGILLTIWNIDYMILLTEKIVGRKEDILADIDSLSRSALAASSDEFLVRKISTILGHRLVIACGKMAIVYSIHCPSESRLLQLIGKAEEQQREGGYLEQRSNQEVLDMTEKEAKLWIKLKDHPDKIKTQDIFTCMFFKLVNEMDPSITKATSASSPYHMVASLSHTTTQQKPHRVRIGMVLDNRNIIMTFVYDHRAFLFI
jgi:hypothetical protein